MRGGGLAQAFQARASTDGRPTATAGARNPSINNWRRRARSWYRPRRRSCAPRRAAENAVVAAPAREAPGAAAGSRGAAEALGRGVFRVRGSYWCARRTSRAPDGREGDTRRPPPRVDRGAARERLVLEIPLFNIDERPLRVGDGPEGGPDVLGVAGKVRCRRRRPARGRPAAVGRRAAATAAPPRRGRDRRR